MKKSQVFVLTAAAIIVLAMVVLIGIGRAAIGKAGISESRSGRIEYSDKGGVTTESMDFEGFSQVVVEGAWTVKVSQADVFSTEIRYSPSMKDRVNVRVEGNRLVLGNREYTGRSGEGMSAEISMPALDKLQVAGAAHTEFQGFESPVLDIIIDGAARIQGFDSEVKQLNVKLNGLGQVDLSEVTAIDADVALDGAGEVVLSMNGGVLKGSLDGLGKIRYSGQVRDEKISVDGLGSVERLD
jgi:hypothetical protein